MKQFEIQTPILKESIDLFRKATNGTLDNNEARTHVAAGNGIVRIVGQELKVRLALPRIEKIESALSDQPTGG